jgi:hypothetical protein
MTRHSFTVYKTPIGYTATLGDYDLDSPQGNGDTPADAIIDWLQMWGDTLEGVKPDYAPQGMAHD